MPGGVSEGVRVACTDQVNRSMLRNSLLGLPASLLLALIFGSTVPLHRLVAFVGFVWVADITSFLLARRYAELRSRGVVPKHYWKGPLATALITTAWASAAVFALPGREHMDLRAVYLIFVCGVSATYVVSSAARRLYYVASQVPLLLIVSSSYIMSGDRVTRLIGFAVPIYLVVMTLMYHEVHTVVVSELSLREANDRANAQLREANLQLSRQALRDDLTGLANRTAFVEDLRRRVAAAQRSGATIGVIYFDIDRFKVVNDSLGHSAGDDLLVQIARRLEQVMRGNDVLARLGGDEFTVLLDDLNDPAEAVAVAERIAGTFATPFDLSNRSVHVSASLGIATSAAGADSAEALLSHADAAQYRAKQGGRDRIELFSHSLREALERRLDNEQELGRAIAGGHVVPWYQPEVELATGRMVGAEALARWLHPTRGVLDAGSFVAIAEETGLIFTLDDSVIGQSIAGRLELARAGVAPADFRVWCNVSARQLTRTRPTQRLANRLKEIGCDPAFIGIEITETAILADMESAAHEIAAARYLGVKVALDDFGTGHSSMTLLRRLPIDKVKIDRSFVQGITRHPRDGAIVRSLVGLAGDLGLEIVAEGVETREQAELLARLGCSHAQGFLWSAALPWTDLAARLGQERASSTLS
jgi:diguanylate cyclase (GGDEF)-like protein